MDRKGSFEDKEEQLYLRFEGTLHQDLARVSKNIKSATDHGSKVKGQIIRRMARSPEELSGKVTKLKEQDEKLIALALQIEEYLRWIAQR